MISVIVPVYNSASYIDEALQSAEVALGKIPHEIIVVNDGSTDNLDEVLRPWMKEIVYVVQENRGAAAARNSGLRRAQGEYIACMDADDIWPEDRMRVLMQAYDTHPEVDIALGYLQRFRVEGERKIFFNEQALIPSFGSALIRAATFEGIGFLENSYRFHEDIDWFLKCVEQGVHIARVPYIASYYRVHEHNTTRLLAASDKRLLRVLAASLQRRKFKQIGSLRDVGI